MFYRPGPAPERGRQKDTRRSRSRRRSSSPCPAPWWSSWCRRSCRTARGSAPLWCRTRGSPRTACSSSSAAAPGRTACPKRNHSVTRRHTDRDRDWDRDRHRDPRGPYPEVLVAVLAEVHVGVAAQDAQRAARAHAAGLHRSGATRRPGFRRQWRDAAPLSREPVPPAPRLSRERSARGDSRESGAQDGAAAGAAGAAQQPAPHRETLRVAAHPRRRPPHRQRHHPRAAGRPPSGEGPAARPDPPAGRLPGGAEGRRPAAGPAGIPWEGIGTGTGTGKERPALSGGRRPCAWPAPWRRFGGDSRSAAMAPGGAGWPEERHRTARRRPRSAAVGPVTVSVTVSPSLRTVHGAQLQAAGRLTSSVIQNTVKIVTAWCETSNKAISHRRCCNDSYPCSSDSLHSLCLCGSFETKRALVMLMMMMGRMEQMYPSSW